MVANSNKPRILLFSQRNIFAKALFRASLFEFEDVIAQIDDVNLVAPNIDPVNRRNSLARRLSFHAPLTLNPGIGKIPIEGNYDLFLAICGAPGDLLMLNAVSDWRKNCGMSICLIDELWVTRMAEYRYFLRILKKFDVVMLYYRQSVEALAERIGRTCVFLPPAADTILFCPYPELPKRVVDVYSIGRRSEITHESLLRKCSEDGMFYLHDTVAGDQALKLRQHRALFARLAKRSRYFIVNPGLIDRPDIRGNQMEIGNRYFEGAAAGVIMVGETPKNEEFEKLFNWPDSVVPLPYDSKDIGLVIDKLDGDPERQERIRRTNVLQALMRHDWVYRWERILETAGLKPRSKVFERKEALNCLAEAVSLEQLRVAAN